MIEILRGLWNQKVSLGIGRFSPDFSPECRRRVPSTRMNRYVYIVLISSQRPSFGCHQCNAFNGRLEFVLIVPMHYTCIQIHIFSSNVYRDIYRVSWVVPMTIDFAYSLQVSISIAFSSLVLPRNVVLVTFSSNKIIIGAFNNYLVR